MNRSTQPGQRTTKFWTPLRAALTLTVCALLATFGVSSCNSSNHTSNANETKINMTVNGSTAPGGGAKTNATTSEAAMLPASVLDTSLKTIDGNAFKLSDLKGKVLVIDLWATWCGPCRYEVPELVQMQTEYGQRGFEVIGLDISPDRDTPEDVSNFIKEFKVNYKVAFAERELAASLMRADSIPQSLVVGRDGQIIKQFIGFNPAKTTPMIREVIEQALQ
jgi:thiol-disulfide isomerase/thioredoxin